MNKYDIIIIGVGFSGAYTALELAKDGYNILLIEKDSEVVGRYSSSFNQCYKLHSGVHYFGDAITASKCLHDSIICAKQWREFLLGEENSAPRRNRHYIMSQSLFDVAEAKKVVNMLKQIYAESAQQDPDNQVFGDPKDFIKEVASDQYSYVASEMNFVNQNGKKEKTRLALALDVGEPQIDVKRLQKHLHYLITHTPNITAEFNCEVTKITPNTNSFGYQISAIKKCKNNSSKTLEFTSKGIVNCAWENIENLDKTAGFCSHNPDKLLIRMKISLLVTLPKELKNMETCIFSLGPYCSITNQFDGTAVLTYEPVTNIGHYFQGEVPPKKMQAIRKILESGQDLTTTPVGKKAARDIINGCAIYVPKIADSTLLEVRVGYVKMYVAQSETYSIYERNSPIHRRREDGIIVQPGVAPCYISASAMKMTYAQSNAEKIRGIMQKEMQKRTEWEKILKEGQHLPSIQELNAIAKTLTYNLKPCLLKTITKNPKLNILSNKNDVFTKILADILDNTNVELAYTKAMQEFVSYATTVYNRVNACTAPVLPTLSRDNITLEFFKPLANPKLLSIMTSLFKPEDECEPNEA